MKMNGIEVFKVRVNYKNGNMLTFVVNEVEEINDSLFVHEIFETDSRVTVINLNNIGSWEVIA